MPEGWWGYSGILWTMLIILRFLLTCLNRGSFGSDSREYRLYVNLWTSCCGRTRRSNDAPSWIPRRTLQEPIILASARTASDFKASLQPQSNSIASGKSMVSWRLFGIARKLLQDVLYSWPFVQLRSLQRRMKTCERCQLINRRSQETFAFYSPRQYTQKPCINMLSHLQLMMYFAARWKIVRRLGIQIDLILYPFRRSNIVLSLVST